MGMYFCNIITRTRLYQFIALYNSIKENSKSFKIFVLCMDEDTFRILEAAKLENLILNRHSEIEDIHLLNLKSIRKTEEYCWTLKPVYLMYVLKHNDIDRLTYLDADLFFYDDPERIFVASDNCSVLLSEHDSNFDIKYVEDYVGRFNAGIISFKNNFRGRECLSWWKKQCIKWCYNTTETGQFGDQKYLEQIHERFNEVQPINVTGVNIAPWNDQKYIIYKKDGNLYINNARLILYHYCGFRVVDKNSCIFMYGNKCIPLIHHPYMKAIKKAIHLVESIDKEFDIRSFEKIDVGQFNIFSLN